VRLSISEEELLPKEISDNITYPENNLYHTWNLTYKKNGTKSTETTKTHEKRY
jgi:hypothetical protein